MKKAISYSLFGYNKERHVNCFDFASYLRGLTINIRMARLLFPSWEVVLHIDDNSYQGFKNLFDKLPIKLVFHPNNEPLCKAMLWRMESVFDYVHPDWTYTHVICRDLDSPPTFRDAQAVANWIELDTCAHAITDSVSHNIPLLGGMIGFKPSDFSQMVGVNTFEKFLSIDPTFNFNSKGSDQTFLNRFVYPKVAEPGKSSITQHFVLGHGNTFLPNYFNYIPDIKLNLDDELKESNSVCGHIGAAGYYEGAMFKFLHAHWDKFNDILDAEKEFPKIFYWCL